MTNEGDLKKCFVIAPIGEEGSDTRERSDIVLEYIIKPVAEECGYEAVRADEISEPGDITSQVIQHLLEDDLVIADLTENNPNVFYELAVRHATEKPIVQIKSDKELPFDVAPQRTIYLDYQDIPKVEECKKEMIRQIRHFENNPDGFESPISFGIHLKHLQQSKDPLAKSNAEIINMLQDIQNTLTKQYRERKSLERDIEKERELKDKINEFQREYNEATERLSRLLSDFDKAKSRNQELIDFLKEIDEELTGIIKETENNKQLTEIRKKIRNFLGLHRF